MNKSKIELLSDEELLKKIFKNDRLVDAIKEKYKPLESIKNATKEELEKDFSKDESEKLLASLELAKRLYLKKPKKHTKLLSACETYEYMRYLFDGLKQEVFYALYFNNKQELIEAKMLYKGLINKVDVHPREIFKEACLLSASRIICMHNHPSGDPKPSVDDIAFTNTIKRAGKFMGIEILDHIIVSDDKYYSFKENESII